MTFDSILPNMGGPACLRAATSNPSGKSLPSKHAAGV